MIVSRWSSTSLDNEEQIRWIRITWHDGELTFPYHSVILHPRGVAKNRSPRAIPIVPTIVWYPADTDIQERG